MSLHALASASVFDIVLGSPGLVCGILDDVLVMIRLDLPIDDSVSVVDAFTPAKGNTWQHDLRSP